VSQALTGLLMVFRWELSTLSCRRRTRRSTSMHLARASQRSTRGPSGQTVYQLYATGAKRAGSSLRA
jgi:hypothetical protein